MPVTEMVASSDLIVGRVYFKVRYHDRDMAVPELVPVVFIGRNLHAAGAGLYFQDVGSYLAGTRFAADDLDGADVFPLDTGAHGVTWGDDESTFEFALDDGHSDVSDFDGALNQLLACSLRRASWDGRVRPAAPAVDGE